METNESKLIPPYGELPPTFWQQHSTLISFAAIAAVALIAFVLWLCLRAKPRPVVPPAQRAREELRALLHRAEDAAVLSRVSQILRRYVIEAFELPKGEFTTAEFCRQIESSPNVGETLAASLKEFLRECDQRKFSPQQPSGKSMNAVSYALELVDLGETRREQLRAESQHNASA